MSTDLKIEGVSKNFGSVSALRDIDMNVEKGSFVCLLGPSGCGKTTLLRIIAGFEHATSGRLLLDGVDVSNVPPHKRGFGMVFQSLALFPHMSVAQNIAYGLKLRGIDKASQRDRVEELLNVIELPTIADRPVAALSGGQRQRVAIARALAVQPKLFLLDEPLSALDAKLRENMQIELRQLQRKFGVTTVLVTHDQTEAMMLADQLVIMDHGVVRQSGLPSQVYREPADAFVADFLGTANVVKGQVTADGAVAFLGMLVQDKALHVHGKGIEVAIRAENIGVVESANPERAILGTVEFVRDLGPNVESIIAVGEEKLRVRSRAREVVSLSAGQQVGLKIDPDLCSFFSR